MVLLCVMVVTPVMMLTRVMVLMLLRYALKKKITGLFGNFSHIGGGGSSQFPKLLKIDQVFHCVPNSF